MHTLYASTHHRELRKYIKIDIVEVGNILNDSNQILFTFWPPTPYKFGI